MTEEKQGLPPHLRSLKQAGWITPNMAEAKALDRLSSTEKLQIMGNLKDKSEMQRPRLMYSIGSSTGEEGVLHWLCEEGDLYMALSCSTDKGRARQDIVKALQTIHGNKDEKGLTDRIRNFISSKAE